MNQLTVGEIIAFVESLYPPVQAESWDRVGLIVGGRSYPVRRILLAVDPVPEVIEQAVAGNYDLLITHHPLYLRGTSFVSEDDAKGRMVAALIKSDCALYNAHTNADVAAEGVAEALAALLGIADPSPLVQSPVAAGTGAGRIGTVASQTLAEFASHAAEVLPAGPHGIMVGGDLDRMVEVIAVSGGAGDSFLGAARGAGADVFLTADLRHHPASEHLMAGGPALICASHWATEWPWLPRLATQIRQRFASRQDILGVEVSSLVTEPWAVHMTTKGLLR